MSLILTLMRQDSLWYSIFASSVGITFMAFSVPGVNTVNGLPVCL